MALRTAFTELCGVRHPIALAPVGGSAGGALAAAAYFLACDGARHIAGQILHVNGGAHTTR
jgi:enoyl-[acyl-carrier-protein] reductase (NADH)